MTFEADDASASDSRRRTTDSIEDSVEQISILAIKKSPGRSTTGRWPAFIAAKAQRPNATP